MTEFGATYTFWYGCEGMVKSALANIGLTMPLGGRREGAGAGAGAGAATGVMAVEYCP